MIAESPGPEDPAYIDGPEDPAYIDGPKDPACIDAEARRDTRQAAEIGRRARVELVFERRGPRTVLAHGYAEPPLRVGRSFVEGDGLHLIMASSAPGIFGGDAFEQIVRVERGARVRLTSQSALQVHASSDRGSATLRSRYVVQEGASLVSQWDPLIPFAGSQIDQEVTIDLEPGARLYWSDAFMSGRVSTVAGSKGPGLHVVPDVGRVLRTRQSDQGECWAFESLSYDLRIRRGATLEYLERFQITPADGRVGLPWTTGDANYFGTTIASGWPMTPDAVEHCHRALQEIEGVRTATDLVDSSLVVARAMAATGVPFHEARARLFRILMNC